MFQDQPLGRAFQAHGMHGVQPITQLGVVALEQVAVTVERERHRRVAGPDGHFLGIGTGGDPEGNCPVPKVVGPKRLQASGADSGSQTFVHKFEVRSTPPRSADNT